jgi:DNA-binding FadR family transcriptional regulator
MPRPIGSARSSGHGYPRGGLHGQIVHAIGRQILSGKIRPGDLLPPQHGLPASRTVLREAIKVLAAKGLVESRPRTGTRVRPRHAWHLLDPDVMAWQQDGAPRVAFLQKLTEVRMIVEPAAAERAAQRATAPDLQALDEAYRDMVAALGGGAEDYEAFDQADMRFHQTIVRACGNDLLERMSHVVVSALLVSFHATSRLPGRAEASLPLHRAILEAIRDGNAGRAGRAMHRLVRKTASEIEAMAKRARR